MLKVPMFTALYLKVVKFSRQKRIKGKLGPKDSSPQFQKNSLFHRTVQFWQSFNNLNLAQFTASKYDGIASIHHMQSLELYQPYQVLYQVVFLRQLLKFQGKIKGFFGTAALQVEDNSSYFPFLLFTRVVNLMKCFGIQLSNSDEKE